MRHVGLAAVSACRYEGIASEQAQVPGFSQLARHLTWPGTSPGRCLQLSNVRVEGSLVWSHPKVS